MVTVVFRSRLRDDCGEEFQAVVGRISAKRRPGEEARNAAAIAAAQPKYDAIAVAIGLALYVVFAFWLHAPLIGVPAVIV